LAVNRLKWGDPARGRRLAAANVKAIYMSWSKGDRHGPRGYHHGNLREALMRAALELIAQKGAAGFTFADAARWAGVSPAAPYRHFRDRDDLLANIALRGFEQFEAVLTRAFDDGRPDAFTALDRMGKAYLALPSSHFSSLATGCGGRSACSCWPSSSGVDEWVARTDAVIVVVLQMRLIVFVIVGRRGAGLPPGLLHLVAFPCSGCAGRRTNKKGPRPAHRNCASSRPLRIQLGAPS